MASAAHESWDPRTWVDPATLIAPRRAAGRRMQVALAGAAAVLCAAGTAAWLARSDAPVAAVQTAAAPTMVTVQRTLRLAGPAQLAEALTGSGLTPAQAAAAADAALSALLADAEIRAVLTLSGEPGRPALVRLEASNPDSSGVVVTPAAAGGFVASRVAAQLSSRVVVRRGRMDADSFYSSAVAAGITDSLIPVFAKALAFDFDFQREVRVGDAFEAAFSQQVNAAGEAVGAPVLLYAALTTATKSSAIYRFAPDGGAAEWFDGSGRSIVRSLMRTPVDGARVSSGFGVRRHPILGFQKLHRGTDFAAPTGTPIFASGDAVVEVAAPAGAAGNFVVLRHDNGWRTRYMHLNRFAPGLAPGGRVAQGQSIGEVGTTGRSTGPHLHYEVFVDGEPVDPMSIETDAGRTLSGAALIGFGRERDRIDVSRAAAG